MQVHGDLITEPPEIPAAGEFNLTTEYYENNDEILLTPPETPPGSPTSFLSSYAINDEERMDDGFGFIAYDTDYRPDTVDDYEIN